jgi:hypothetical protein
MTTYNEGHTRGSLWDDMPWWVKAVALVGVPSLISVGVIYSDRVQLAQDVRVTNERVQAIERDAANHDVRVNLRFQELHDTTKESNRILVAMCVNAAQTSLDRERCVGR